jgi:uncharacterized protein (TIGR02996 family)
MKGIEKELARIIKPFDVDVALSALAGQPTVFDTDASWSSHHHGQPRTVPRGIEAFDGTALVAGMQTLSFLAANLPVADARRDALPVLWSKIRQRLANPELMLFVAFDVGGLDIGGQKYDLPGATVWQPIHGWDNGALVVSGGYLYFRPAAIQREADLEICASRTTMQWPREPFGWSGVYGAWKLVLSADFAALVERATVTPLSPGQFESDPLASAPELVSAARAQFGISEDASILYLQLLALCDCSDKWLREVNGWTPTKHKKAVAELVAANLVDADKKPRANRNAALPGTWEKLRTPQPAIESWKLPLYDARVEEGALLAPLGRILPLRPVHQLFEAAWNEIASGRTPGATRAASASSREWVVEIAAAPDDDALRLVYADYLAERGDPRGELITLQIRRHQRARGGGSDAELAEVCRAETGLLEAHGKSWLEPVYGWIEDARWDRGFITSITIHADKFANHADKIFEALPLLREIRLLNGRRNQIAGLVGCPQLARIRHLDFTPDEYVRELADLELLLGGEHLPELEYLRIGYHRPGEGFGAAGGKAIASCPRLGKLRFLEIAGQNLGLAGVRAIVQSTVLSSLEVLRVPYNKLRTPGGGKLAELLEDGALPNLRVLDVGNVVDTGFVTKAVEWHKNKVDAATQQRIVIALGRRRSDTDIYTGDPVAEPATPVIEPLPQTGKYPFAAIAKSGLAACVVCRKKIDKGTVRIGIEREHPEIGRITSWLHVECKDGCPELRGIPDLDERLARIER